MKILKKFIKTIPYLAIFTLIIYITIISKYDVLNYKFYTVLTNSMEPTIPTGSLVCVKNFKEDEPINLKPKEIITFHANRFGENIIITHRFNKTEIDKDGNTIYRTNAEDKENIDIYETKRYDLIGTYLFHIPYIGRIILFLKSKFGFILYGRLITISLINMLIKSIWKEKLDESVSFNILSDKNNYKIKKTRV